MAQAVATTIIRKRKSASIASPEASVLLANLPALEKMLWGGTVMLIVDHIINGELTWQFPFFTALNELGGAQIVLGEILNVGVPMSVVLTLVWVAYSFVKAARAARA